MVCKKCGKEIKVGGAFCPNCGVDLSNMEEVAPVSTPKTLKKEISSGLVLSVLIISIVLAFIGFIGVVAASGLAINSVEYDHYSGANNFTYYLFFTLLFLGITASSVISVINSAHDFRKKSSKKSLSLKITNIITLVFIIGLYILAINRELVYHISGASSMTLFLVAASIASIVLSFKYPIKPEEKEI
ncbi:MAG: hypothetical protein LBV55_02785 [Acholeplasmatales bacterium]|jgi:magnesium-transporting ATPase (P-type)|nr:hypothetical protein [Acholeplasmatales bacterium]